MNISINNYCNHDCGFCFQKSWYLSDDKSNMSVGMFKDIIKWSNKKMIKLLGGEPLLHPDIEEMIRYLNDCNIKVVIFSNLDVDYELIKRLNSYKIKWNININCPEERLDNVITNLQTLTDCEIGFTFQHNNEWNKKMINRALGIYCDCKNLDNRLRVSTMSPIEGMISDFDYTETLKYLIQHINNCRIVFDCNINCSEYDCTKVDLSKFNRGGRCDSEIYPFDVLYDGQIVFCCSIHRLGIGSYRQYSSLDDAKLAMKKIYDDWNKITPSECEECSLLHKICKGMCPSRVEFHNKNSIKCKFKKRMTNPNW